MPRLMLAPPGLSPLAEAPLGIQDGLRLAPAVPRAGWGEPNGVIAIAMIWSAEQQKFGDILYQIFKNAITEGVMGEYPNSFRLVFSV